jgi:type IV secretion system protein VirB8
MNNQINDDALMDDKLIDHRFLNYLNYTSNFEQAEKDSIASKIKTKNIIIGVLSACLCSSTIALAVMMPLKQKVPVIIQVDNLKGTTSVLTNTDVEKLNTHKEEAIDKHNLADYVITREGYDWNYGEASYNHVMLMTAQSIAKDYQFQYSDENPKALHLKYGNNTRVVIKNPSVSFYENSAMVKFTREVITSNAPPVITQEMATIAYQYITADMTDNDRLINPLGFQVNAYRVDKDLTAGAN